MGSPLYRLRKGLLAIGFVQSGITFSGLNWSAPLNNEEV